MWRPLVAIIIVAGALAGGFFYRGPLEIFAAQIYGQVLPCRNPITYSLGSIDPRFDLSENQIVRILDEAAEVWSDELGRTLFSYAAEGGVLEINFVYDDRQQTTSKLKSIGVSISNDKAAYDTVNAEYQKILAEYQRDKSRFESDAAKLSLDSAAYEAEVARVNARGGATPAEYAQLQAEKSALQTRQDALQTRQKQLNTDAADVNAMVATLNRLAKEVNTGASTYNDAAQGHEEEFEEAIFRSAPGWQEINVYEFDSRAKLVRVLSHEFGHALGLGHVEDSDAIMYRLNQSTNIEPTADDIAELKKACRIS